MTTDSGIARLQAADWLLGFDFDGTLADVTDGHSVAPEFFSTISALQQQQRIAWGICTGRSLEFLIEGMENAAFPFWPDYVVAQERDVFYLNADGTAYLPDHDRNEQAESALLDVLTENAPTLAKAQTYIEEQTAGQWISIPGDPAGIIATTEAEIAHAVAIFDACPHKTPLLDYQRNTIYLRFTHRHYCKGTAIQFLQQRYNISHAQTLVMGDNYNDITMLNDRVAQHYGGPANSISNLKTALNEQGGFITETPYAHGVVEALLRLVK